MTGSMLEFYPGGNTSQGFYSFYDYIFDSSFHKVYILKGGPGVGKSTFMRRIGEDCLAAGYQVEFHYCSSDNNSLDGIVVPKLGVAVIDGTAPHVVDPKHPGAVDIIINLGRYWQENELRSKRAQIIASTREYQRCFRRAYGYLKAASVFWHEVNSYYHDTGAFQEAALNQRVSEIIADLTSSTSPQYTQPRGRHLFVSAITPRGCDNKLGTLAAAAERCIVIQEAPCMKQNVFITQLIAKLELMSLDYTAFHCALHPEKIEHLYIPALDLVVITSNSFHKYAPAGGDMLIAMDTYIDWDVMKPIWQEREQCWDLFSSFLEKGVEFIAKAKAEHDVLETYYIPSMKFHEIEAHRQRIAAEILNPR